MGAEKKKQRNALGLIVALVVVLMGSVLFVGAVSGWFSDGVDVVLDEEYYCNDNCDGEYMELSGSEYERLMEEKKSFVVFVDQKNCTTAITLGGYVSDYAKEAGIKVYRMMFSEARETSMHDYVKYYPSVVIVSKGRVAGYLRADSDEDADMYNDQDAFVKWMERYL